MKSIQAARLAVHVCSCGIARIPTSIRAAEHNPFAHLQTVHLCHIANKLGGVLERLDVISRASSYGVSATDPAFRSLAASLKLTPSQLFTDLMRMKEQLQATTPTPSASAKG